MSNLNLTVYDALGHEVAVFVTEELKAGIYQADWNVTNFPSGVYFNTLRAGDPSTPLGMTKKMAVVK